MHPVLDLKCAELYMKDPEVRGNKVFAHKVGKGRGKSCPKVINIEAWYSPTRNWNDAGPILLEYLKHNDLPQGEYTLTDLIRITIGS